MDLCSTHTDTNTHRYKHIHMYNEWTVILWVRIICQKSFGFLENTLECIKHNKNLCPVSWKLICTSHGCSLHYNNHLKRKEKKILSDTKKFPKRSHEGEKGEGRKGARERKIEIEIEFTGEY